MTTIAALARDGHVWMAGDSATNVYDRPILDGARKVRRLTGDSGVEILLGFCGVGALAGLIPAKLLVEPMPQRDEGLQPWAASIAWAVSDLAFEARLTQDGQMDASILLGAAGRLWTLSNYGAIPHPDGVAALGSGEGPAMGALDVLLELDIEPAAAVVRAAQVAVARDQHSAAPIYLEHLPPAGSDT